MSTYSLSGVDIDAGDRAVELMKSSIAKTNRKEVIGGLGGFAGYFDISNAKKFNKPVLATSTDGVGTKTAIAQALKEHKYIGEDLVAMVVDDLVVSGAEPLYLTDYIAVGKVIPEKIAELVASIARGCRKAGVALIGGETAEHPGLMEEDEFDLAGAATGIVDGENMLGSHLVKAGDVAIAMPASGFHANGYSLIRYILKNFNLSLDTTIPELQKTLGEVLITPTEIYALDCLALYNSLYKNSKSLHAFAHITGGGLAENTARVLPDNLHLRFDRTTWALPLEMEYLAKIGQVPLADLERTWNCGIGMVAIVAPNDADLAIRSLFARGMDAWVCGEVINANNGNYPSAKASLAGNYQKR